LHISYYKFIIINCYLAFPASATVSAALKVKAKAKTIKVWPRGTSKPRPGLEDYMTAVALDKAVKKLTFVQMRVV